MLINEDGDFNDHVRNDKRAQENIQDVLYRYIYCRPGSITGSVEEQKE